jgi:hypothetical protein
MSIEPHFVYPLLRGRDVRRWSAKPTFSVIIPQDTVDPAKGLAETRMQSRQPKTYAYLKQFEEQLRKRSGFKQYFDASSAPFYSVYNVGPYTFKQYKVVWREQASFLTAAVPVSDGNANVIVPDHKLMLCPGETLEEVHYLCALLNSLPAQFVVKSYSLETSVSTHVFNYVAIRTFDAKDKIHLALATNSKALHASTAAGDTAEIEKLEAENLKIAAAYWGLDRSEVADIKASIDELA